MCPTVAATVATRSAADHSAGKLLLGHANLATIIHGFDQLLDIIHNLQTRHRVWPGYCA